MKLLAPTVGYRSWLRPRSCSGGRGRQRIEASYAITMAVVYVRGTTVAYDGWHFGCTTVTGGDEDEDVTSTSAGYNRCAIGTRSEVVR